MLEELAVSAAMAVQDQCGGSQSNSVLQAGNGVPLNSGLHLVTGSLHKEQFSCGNDFSPKVRKPYTITKRRERWTEEEHKKFLEALKLYGRAWRRSEEHVGSKTAIQIRSHAQKFFSKVVRESSGTTASPEEPIEIPPPRPKRKPTHPYPRKVVNQLTKEALTSENRLRSSSPNFSVSEHENKSPSSVFSVVCSDALGSTDSNMPNCSQSPVSCADGSHSANLTVSETNLGQAANDELSPKKLDLFVKEDVSEDGLVEETSTRSLKLFGRTLLITECQGDRAIGSPKPPPTCTNDVHFLQASGGHYYLQLQTVNSNRTEELGYAVARPWWALYGGLLSPIGAFPKQETVNVILDSSEEFQEKEIQKEGSSTGSNSGSLNGEENVESYNGEKVHNPIPERKPIERSASSKGFVPYKKRAADNECLTGEEREDKHIRLSL